MSVMGELDLAVLFLHMGCMMHDASQRLDFIISGINSRTGVIS